MIKKPAKKKEPEGSNFTCATTAQRRYVAKTGRFLAHEVPISIHAPIRGCDRAYAQLVAVLVLTLFQCSTALSEIDNRTFILDVKGPG